MDSDDQSEKASTADVEWGTYYGDSESERSSAYYSTAQYVSCDSFDSHPDQSDCPTQIQPQQTGNNDNDSGYLTVVNYPDKEYLIQAKIVSSSKQKVEHIPNHYDSISTGNESTSNESYTNLQPRNFGDLFSPLGLAIIFSFVGVTTIFIYTATSIRMERLKLPIEGLIHLPCRQVKELTEISQSSKLDKDKSNVGNEEKCHAEISALIRQLALNKLGENIVAGFYNLEARKEDRKVMPFSKYNLTIKTSSETSGRTSITIPFTGRYFVYFGVQLLYGQLYERPNCSDLEYKISLVHLLRYSPDPNPSNRYRTILRHQHTCCQKCLHEKKMKFSGGLFQFKANDQILIQASAPPIIGVMSNNSLGIYRIPD